MTKKTDSENLYAVRYIKLGIEYDGTNFQGWQSQRTGRTVQDIIRAKIFEITGEQVRLTGASRTDAGVHALDQIAVFGSHSELPVHTIMRALNAKLPGDIRILNAEETDHSFNPRFRAARKRYMYILSLGPRQSTFLSRYFWLIQTKLNSKNMRHAAFHLIGKHDFSCFRASGCGARTAVRTIYAIEITRYRKIRFMTHPIEGDFLRIRIEADAFLRHMVRNIVGTLVEVGKGKLEGDSMKTILKSLDRKQAGPAAPARGLFLERIIF